MAESNPSLKNNRNRNLLIIIIGIILVIIILILFFINLIKNVSDEEDSGEASVITEIEEAEETETLENLYNMTEQERITYYCAEFFKLIDIGNYSKAYSLLYYEYADSYFPTETSFSQYMKDYFPDDFSVSYTNFERLGDIYILWVDIKDTLNGSYGHNFSMNVVIQENDYNDFVLSFSRNSAVEEE